jgi:hypothetical protein
MKWLTYEIKRYLLVFLIVFCLITTMLTLSIFYETNFEYLMDQILLILALFAFLITSSILYIKHISIYQTLYYTSNQSDLHHVLRFTVVMSVMISALLLYGISYINIKALLLYESDVLLFMNENISSFAFVLINRMAYEILMMLMVYVFNIFVFSLTTSYAIYLVFYRIKHERIYTEKITLIRTLSYILALQVFYRLFLILISKPIYFLNLNVVGHFKVIEYGNLNLFINVFFIPAMIVFGIEIYRMVLHVKTLEHQSKTVFYEENP